MSPIPRLKAYRGPALLSYGFRPFFLLGAIYAGLAILAWLPIFNGELALSTAFGPIDWHVHEMLYGYLPAVVTGFLLTAIPNWTGRLPIQGTPLLTLVVVWLAGRMAVIFSAEIGWLPAAIIDVGFLVLVVQRTERFSDDAGCLCRSRHRRARAYLLVAGTGLERAVVASLSVRLGGGVFRLCHIVWAAARSRETGTS
jgi:uncharacterized protein involved in response to NO